MKKSLLSLLLCLLPLSTFFVLTKQTSANVIYLHKEQKGTRSSQGHLNVFSSTGNVVLKFYADWCGPCNRMAPLINNCAAAMPDIIFININRDFFSDLASTFSVTSIPTLIFLHDGKVVGRYDGSPLTQEKLNKLVRRMFQNY